MGKIKQHGEEERFIGQINQIKVLTFKNNTIFDRVARGIYGKVLELVVYVGII